MIKKNLLIFILILTMPLLSVAHTDFPYDDKLKAEKLFQQKNFDLALKYYVNLHLETPQDLQILRNLSTCYLNTRQIDKAIDGFTKALLQDPNHEETILNLGYALKMAGKYSEARNWYIHLSRINPQYGKYLVAASEFSQESAPVSAQFKIKADKHSTTGADFAMTLVNGKLIGATTFKFHQSSATQKQAGPSNHVLGQNVLYTSHPSDSVKQLLQPSRNLHSNIGPITFAPNTGLIAYTINHFTEGNRQLAQAEIGLKISFAYLDANGDWVDEFDFPFNNDSYSSGYPFLTPDGQTLYFASNMDGGYGGFDMYVSYLQENDSWSTPQNLGPRINTPGNEISPFFDGQFLYFSSDWHPGYGGLDVFRADFDYESWVDPVNLGKEINSTHDDFGFVYFDKMGKGFLISDRPGGKGHEDIYAVLKKSKRVAVTVMDFKTQQAVTGALVDLTRCGDPAGITDESGLFNFEIREGFDCYITIGKVGYTNTSFRLRFQDIEGQEKNYKLMLTGTANFHEGRIVDSVLDQPVGGVYISAVNELDGEVQETYSDQMGNFALHIKPRGRYHISFAKTGYTPQYIDKLIGTKVQEDILGKIVFERAENVMLRDYYRQGVFASSESKPATRPNAAEMTASTSAIPIDTKSEIVSKEIAKSTSKKPEEKKAPSIKPKSETIKDETPPPAIKLAKVDTKESNIAGYVIQVAAIAKKRVDITPFKYFLSKFGSIYVSKRDDQLLRIMVGVYDNKEDAESALFKIREEKFKEAFITPLPVGVQLDRIEDYAAIEEKQIVSATPLQPSLSGSQEYMVKIGSFKNLSWFDNKEVEAIGLIEEIRGNGSTTVLLSGYTSIEEASEALSKVKALGYKDAHVVTSQGGELKKVH
jgi:hypothetical protein